VRSLIIVPTYNEKGNLRPLVEDILGRVPAQVDLLVVDDGSPDGTGLLADELAQETGRVHVLHRSGKLGLGSAYVAGFHWGLERDYQSLIQMDADFSHHPSYLGTMLDVLERNDVAVGSRYVKGGGTRHWGLFRRLLSRGGSFYSRIILGVGLRDFTGGFNGWSRNVLLSLELDSLRSDGYSFQIEMKYRASKLGARVEVFPIVFEDRKVGQSKMSRAIIIEALWRVWELRWRRISFEKGLSHKESSNGST